MLYLPSEPWGDRTPIEDCAKDGGEEFFTKMHCVLRNRLLSISAKLSSVEKHLNSSYMNLRYVLIGSRQSYK